MVKKLAEPSGGPEQESGTEGDRVWVNISRKVSLGKFDMLEVGVGSAASLLPGETAAEAIKRIASTVREEHAELLELARDDSSV